MTLSPSTQGSATVPTLRHSTPLRRPPRFKTVGLHCPALEVTPALASSTILSVPQPREPLLSGLHNICINSNEVTTHSTHGPATRSCARLSCRCCLHSASPTHIARDRNNDTSTAPHHT